MKYGFGRLIWPKGPYFEGYWEENRAYGQGVFRTLKGQMVEGQWF